MTNAVNKVGLNNNVNNNVSGTFDHAISKVKSQYINNSTSTDGVRDYMSTFTKEILTNNYSDFNVKESLKNKKKIKNPAEIEKDAKEFALNEIQRNHDAKKAVIIYTNVKGFLNDFMRAVMDNLMKMQ